jgi:hypothetical protein
MDAVALGNRGQRFTGSAALDRFGSLVVAQLPHAAEFDAGGHRALAAFASPFANKGRTLFQGPETQIRLSPLILQSPKCPMRRNGNDLFNPCPAKDWRMADRAYNQVRLCAETWHFDRGNTSRRDV